MGNLNLDPVFQGRVPGTAAGDIFNAQMRRAGLLPEDDEEAAEQSLFDPVPELSVQLGREKTYAEIAESGFVSGLAGGAAGILGAVESFGLGGDVTEEMTQYLDQVQVEHAPPEAIQKELRHDPWLVLDPTWWTYNIPNFAASTAPMLAGGGAGGLLFKSIARLAPGLAGGAAHARTAFAGALNMMTVGGGVYAETVEGGATHEEAARLSHISMIADAPFAFMEALMFMNPKLLATKIPKFMRGSTRKGMAVQNSIIEGLQETGEQVFADNLVTGKPLTTGVLESMIAGPVIGGPTGFIQGPQFDPSIKHSNAIESLKEIEPIEGLNDPNAENADQLIDDARNPIKNPNRVNFLDGAAGFTRESLDEVARLNGNPIPMADDQYEAILKGNLRVLGYYESDLDGRTIQELEEEFDASTRRVDVQIPLNEQQKMRINELGQSSPEGDGRDRTSANDRLRLGDTFVRANYFEPNGDKSLYRVSEVREDGVVGTDLSTTATSESGRTSVRGVDTTFGLEDEVIIQSRSMLTGKLVRATPAPQASDVQLDPNAGDIVPGEPAGLLPAHLDPKDIRFIATSRRDAQGRFAKPSIEDVAQVQQEGEETVPELQAIADPNTIATPEMDQAMTAATTDVFANLTPEQIAAIVGSRTEEDADAAPPVQEGDPGPAGDIIPQDEISIEEIRALVGATDDEAVVLTPDNEVEVVTPEVEVVPPTEPPVQRLEDTNLQLDDEMLQDVEEPPDVIPDDVPPSGLPQAAQDLFGVEEEAEPEAEPNFLQVVEDYTLEFARIEQKRAQGLARVPDERTLPSEDMTDIEIKRNERARVEQAYVASLNSLISDLDENIGVITGQATSVENVGRLKDRVEGAVRAGANAPSAELQAALEQFSTAETQPVMIPSRYRRPTINNINRFLPEGVEVARHEGGKSFYFTDPNLFEATVYVPRLSDMTVKEWVEEYHRKVEETKARVSTVGSDPPVSPRDATLQNIAPFLPSPDEDLSLTIPPPEEEVEPAPVAAQEELPPVRVLEEGVSGVDENLEGVVPREEPAPAAAEPELSPEDEAAVQRILDRRDDVTREEAIAAVTGLIGRQHTPAERTGEAIDPAELVPTDEQLAIEEEQEQLDLASDPVVEAPPPAETQPRQRSSQGRRIRPPGLWETNPDDPPESEWRKDNKVHKLLASGAPFKWRDWMTNTEKGLALFNLGFRRRDRSRKVLTNADGSLTFSPNGDILAEFEKAAGKSPGFDKGATVRVNNMAGHGVLTGQSSVRSGEMWHEVMWHEEDGRVERLNMPEDQMHLGLGPTPQEIALQQATERVAESEAEAQRLTEEAFETLTDAELMSMGRDELTDLARMAGVPERSIGGPHGGPDVHWWPGKGRNKGKRVGPSTGAKGSKFEVSLKELRHLIRERYPAPGSSPATTAEPEFTVPAPAPDIGQEGPAPAPDIGQTTPPPGPGGETTPPPTNTQEIPTFPPPEDFLADPDMGMSDEDLENVFDDEALFNEIQQKREAEARNETPQQRREREAMIQASIAETSELMTPEQHEAGAVWVNDMKVITEDGKEGRLIVSDKGPHRVRVEGEKKVRFYTSGSQPGKVDAFELLPDNTLRVKATKAGVSDATIAEARARIHGATDENMHKRFKDKSGKVSLEEFKKWAKSLGISLDAKSTRQDVVRKVRFRLATKKGKMSQEPTRRGDAVMDAIRRIGKKSDLEGGIQRRISHISGWLLPDGTFYIMPSFHMEHALGIYESIGVTLPTQGDPEVDSTSDLRFANEYDAVRQISRDSGAIQVSIESGLGGSHVTFHTSVPPSRAQTMEMASSARRDPPEFIAYTLELAGSGFTEFDVAEYGPKRASGMIRNYWMRASSEAEGMQQDPSQFGWPPDLPPQLDPRYTDEHLNPLPDETAERIAQWVANYSPDTVAPMAFGRMWVLGFDSTEDAALAMFDTWLEATPIELTADQKARSGLHKVPGDVKFVVEAVKNRVDIGTLDFLGVAANAQQAIRELVKDGEYAKLQQILDIIKKDVNRGVPMALVVRNAINILRPNRLSDPGFMPHPDDVKGISYVKPPSWDVPLEDPLAETLAQQTVELGITGVAGPSINESMTIQKARALQWESRFGPLSDVFGNGVMRSVRNPGLYTPNDDILIRQPRTKKGRVKTLANVIPQMVSKGPVKWLRSKLQPKNPLDDVAVLGQFIRDPRVENYVVYYVNDQDVVVGADILSSKLPDITDTFGTIGLEGWQFISAKAGLLGATKVATAHNHPVGWPSPSRADMELGGQEFALASDVGLDHLGHVIVNDGAYVTLDVKKANTILTDMDSVEGLGADNQEARKAMFGILGNAVKMNLLDPAIGKSLRRGAFADDLTTPGLESQVMTSVAEKALSRGEDVDPATALAQEREALVRAHVTSGREVSPEDMAAYMSSMTTSDTEGGTRPPVNISDLVRTQILDYSMRLAHQEEGVIFVYSDIAGRITSVQSVDLAVMQSNDDAFLTDMVNNHMQASNASDVHVYLTSQAAASSSSGGGGFDQTVEGTTRRFWNSGLLSGYAIPEQGSEVSGMRFSIDPKWRGLGGVEGNFRDVYRNLDDWNKELVLFTFGQMPGLRASDLNGPGGMWYHANENREWFERYKAKNEQNIIDHFVNMGANKAIDFGMLRQLEPGEDPTRIPWREMGEKSTISRRSQPRKGMEQDEAVAKKLGRNIVEMVKSTRGHEDIPMDEATPNINIFREHYSGGADLNNKWTAAEETLADPKTMEQRLFQTFEITDLPGLLREVGNVFKNITSGAGIKKSVLAGIRRIQPFMAKWLYDTEHAITVWTDIVNEHRLSRGGEALSSTADPRKAIDQSRQVGGRIEQKVKEYNTIIKIYGDEKNGKQLGLTDQEHIDLGVYLDAKQAMRRISVAEGRFDKLQALRRENREARRLRKELSDRLKDRSLTPEARDAIKDARLAQAALVKETDKAIGQLEKIVVERKVTNDLGQVTDIVFDQTKINPGGATTEQAAGAIEELRQKVGDEKFAKMEEVDRELNGFWDGMLDISHDAGLISRQDMIQMKEANHLHGNYMGPFDIIRHYHQAASSGGSGPMSRGGISVFDHKLYENMVATNSDTRDIIVTSVDKIASIISFAAKNKAMRTFHDSRLLWEGAELEDGQQVGVGQEVADEDLQSVMMNVKVGQEVPEGYRKVHYWRDGKRITFAVYNPIADSLLGTNRPVAGPTMRAVRFFTKWLRAGATALSPSFIAWNLPRDFLTQYISADNPLRLSQGKDLKLLWDSIGAALKASWNPETIDPVLEEFMAWGAGYGGQVESEITGGFTDAESDREIKRRMESSRRTVLGRDIEDPAGMIDKAIGLGANVMRAINPFGSGMSISEALEQGTRFAVFQKELQAQGVEISVAGMRDATPEQQQAAIFAGRRSTVDFSRGGRALLFANMMAPFTNAAVQGVRTTAGGIMKHPGRAANLLALGVFTEMILAIMNRENFGDMLDEEEDWRRRKSFTLIVDTWIDDNGEEHPISLHLPKGDLLSAATVPFQDFMDHAWRAKTDPNVGITDNAGGVFDTLVDMFSEASPVEFTRNGTFDLGLVVSRFLPVPVRATLEVMTDRNFYFDREIEGRLKDMLTEDRIKRDTTDFAIFMSGVAGTAFDVLGDRETNPFSPVVIDALVKAHFAEGGAIATRMLGTGVNIVTDPFSPVTFGSAASARMFGRDVGPRDWEDWLEVAAYTPAIKRFLSVRGGKQERLQMESLERANQIMGSRRAQLIRPVRAMVLNRNRMTPQEWNERIATLTPEQLDMMRTELEREAQGLGPSNSVARTLRSMSVQGWGRAVGITEIMNRNITNPVERIQFLNALAYSEVLTPTVMSQLMLLAGNGALRRPDRVLPGVPGLPTVTEMAELRLAEMLPVVPNVTRRRRTRNRFLTASP
mgnify:CR=1 FL=1|tara:strand:+ start:5318 stop:17005 length:11688 start_codon:yes stop_codon:yes gene_type:complete